MKTGFDWQTEDENTVVAPEEQQRLQLSHRQRGLLWGVVFVLVAVGLGSWQVWQRQTTHELEMQADVNAGFQIWYQAVRQNDVDLFRFQLARADRDWLRTQGKLFASGLALDREPIGLTVVQDPVVEPRIETAPDYASAQITFEQRYLPAAALNTTSEVRLQHTAVFHNEDGRWVKTVPDAEFWGPMQRQAGTRLSLVYPQRDAQLGLQLWQDLEAALQTVCDEQAAVGGYVCDQAAHLDVELRADAGLLAALPDMDTPVFDGRTLLLPTPTLVGIPLDSASYKAFLQGYAGRLVETFKTTIATPLPLPAQEIYTLCLTYPSEGFRLQRYDPFLNRWSRVEAERPYQFLDALPDDSALLLQEKPDSTEPNRLHLQLRSAAGEATLVDDTTRQWQPRPVGWQTTTDPSRLLLQGADLFGATTFYRWLDLATCNAGSCELLDLPGFVLWSPTGAHTVVVDDSELYFGDAHGQTTVPIEAGLHPLWLDDETLAYARFVEQNGRISMDVVARGLDSETATPLFDADDLAAAASIPEKGQLFIKYMSASPVDPRLLLLGASGIGNYAGEYFIFSVQVGTDDPLVVLRERREGAPQGFPTLLTPTGYPPFSLSPDGRWLVFSDLVGTRKDTWVFYLHDMGAQQTHTLRTTFPAYPARYPFYDWSADGRWLVIQDDGFMRLVAPGVDFQRLVPHEFDACYYTAWVNE